MFWSAEGGESQVSISCSLFSRYAGKRTGEGKLTDGEEESRQFPSRRIQDVLEGKVVEITDVVVRVGAGGEGQGVSPPGLIKVGYGQDGCRDQQNGEYRDGTENTHQNHWNEPTASPINEINNIERAFFLLSNPE